MLPRHIDATESADLVAVARGRTPADLVVRHGRVVNVYSEEIQLADVAVRHGRIAYVGSEIDAVGESTEVIDADGAFVLPGYIEPHCHPWALYNPDTLARAVLPMGNTALVGELLNIQLVVDSESVRAIYRQLQHSPMRWFWAVRVGGQSGQPLEGPFAMDALRSLLSQDGVVQIAEITAWPQVLDGDLDLLQRMSLAAEHGIRLDGHTSGATASKVAALAAAGFTADHEPISRDEALERLRNGYHVILRHSSLRPDLEDLSRLVIEGKGVARMSLTSDGSGPGWLQRHGMVDGLVRRLVGGGVQIPRAVALATVNPATYLRLDEQIGGLAPRRCADLQVLADFDGRAPDVVVMDGQVTARSGELVARWPTWDWQRHLDVAHQVDISIASDPATYRSPSPPGRAVPAMRFVSAGIARSATVTPDATGWPPGAVLAVLFSRDGASMAWAWLDNFAPRLRGLASSYTTSGDFLVIGRDPADMARAAEQAFSGRGGIAIAEGGHVVSSVDLDVAGSMASRPMSVVADEWASVERHVRRAGYPFDELLFCLCFITCDFLPDLRLVREGLLEVKTRKILVRGIDLQH